MKELNYYYNMYGRLTNEYKGQFGDYWKREAIKKVEDFKNTIIIDNIPRWKTNNRIPPFDLLLLWNQVGKEFDLLKTINIAEEENEKLLERYKKQERALSLEEINELKNTFGENASVIDIITGKRVI